MRNIFKPRKHGTKLALLDRKFFGRRVCLHHYTLRYCQPTVVNNEFEFELRIGRYLFLSVEKQQ